jgi:hypothetical protein
VRVKLVEKKSKKNRESEKKKDEQEIGRLFS